VREDDILGGLESNREDRDANRYETLSADPRNANIVMSAKMFCFCSRSAGEASTFQLTLSR
jgi:hypothetical protein